MEFFYQPKKQSMARQDYRSSFHFTEQDDYEQA